MKITLDSVNISGKLNDFAQYLETTDRIILSAKFGDGKTYLLNKLRNDEAMKDKYEFFTIYPVNYSVAKNEDVFEYIKRRQFNIEVQFVKSVNYIFEQSL